MERRSLKKEVELVALRQAARRSASRGMRPTADQTHNRSALRAGSSQREERHLRALADAYGIETSYVDMSGEVCHVSSETLKAILKLRGCVPNPERSPGEAEVAPNLLAPAYVAWHGFLRGLTIPGGPRHGQQICRIRVLFEHGAEKNLDGALSELPDKKIGHQLGKLPFGYHRLQVEIDGQTAESLIISAPRQSYANESARSQRLGFFAPLYALQSQESWGAGNFSDLKRLARWGAGRGADVLATLPLMAGFLDSGGDPSPYSPISRLFWNEFYVDIERLPELAHSTAARKKLTSASFRNRLKMLKSGQWVDYSAGMKLRREVLQLLAPHVNQAEIVEFMRERPEVSNYARFRAMNDKLGIPWQRWPERLRNGGIQSTDFGEEDERYYLFAQFAAQRQMNELAVECRKGGVQLYLDLPVGVNRCGFDVWQNKELFASGASVGAPPDMFFNQGQNWGFPPMIPEQMRQTRYAHIRNYLRFQMRHAGILRIDHIMGLHRLYWIPPGFSAREGAYVKYPAEELHAIVCLESHRNRCEIVGENLGIVPEEVNRAMDEHRYRRMYIVQFEQRAIPRALSNPPSGSVASLETHDTSTFTAHWLGKDIEFRVKLGQLKRTQAGEERNRRQELNRATEKFLIAKRLLKGPDSDARSIMQALVRWLQKGPAGIVLFSLESLWGEKLPQNVPGTMKEYRNWRRKAAVSLEELDRYNRYASMTKPFSRDIRSMHNH